MWKNFRASAGELIGFVRAHEMGVFYAGRIGAYYVILNFGILLASTWMAVYPNGMLTAKGTNDPGWRRCL